MEQVFFSELTQNSVPILVSANEAKHLKVLRLKIGDKVLASNGKGLTALCTISDITKNHYQLTPLEFYHNLNEVSKKIALALAILSSKERFEFALEKAIELGITDFFPIITTYSQKKHINIDRLYSKAISSFKQAKRSILTQIHPPIELFNIKSTTIEEYHTIIITDDKGEKPQPIPKANNIIIFVGPEGGFTPSEIDYLVNLKRFNKTVTKWKLSETRLRAETASISAVAIALQL